MPRLTVAQIPIALALLTIALPAFADPIDDAQAALDDDEPCRAQEILEDAEGL